MANGNMYSLERFLFPWCNSP